MLETFTLATFADRIGERFQVDTGAQEPSAIELIEVSDLTSRGGPETARRERAPFSIVFRGARETLLPQQIYRMQHAAIGDFELFLVPIGPDREGQRYEAVFT